MTASIRFVGNQILFICGQIVMGQECCECPYYCPSCMGNYGPHQFQITVSGITNVSPSAFCTTCSTLNGTFVLDSRYGFVCPPNNSCLWKYEGLEITCPPAPYCPPDYTGTYYLSATHNIGDGTYTISVSACWNVSADCSGIPPIIGWSKTYAAKPDCLNLLNESLPLTSSDSHCNADSSTCVITAL